MGRFGRRDAGVHRFAYPIGFPARHRACQGPTLAIIVPRLNALAKRRRQRWLAAHAPMPQRRDKSSGALVHAFAHTPTYLRGPSLRRAENRGYTVSRRLAYIAIRSSGWCVPLFRNISNLLWPLAARGKCLDVEEPFHRSLPRGPQRQRRRRSLAHRPQARNRNHQGELNVRGMAVARLVKSGSAQWSVPAHVVTCISCRPGSGRRVLLLSRRRSGISQCPTGRNGWLKNGFITDCVERVSAAK